MTVMQPAIPALPNGNRTGQGTVVEQSRAIAEVQAAVVVAQQMPRDIDRAVREMRRSCGQRSLAEKAFYRFPRAGETISGETVQLAQELARCFGNMQYGIVELRRDDGYGQSRDARVRLGPGDQHPLIHDVHCAAHPGHQVTAPSPSWTSGISTRTTLTTVPAACGK